MVSATRGSLVLSLAGELPLAGEFSLAGERSLARGFTPRMDIHESPEQNVVTATFELPGLTRENVNIDIQNGRLVVSGEQTISKDVEEKGFVHRERQTGRFSRTLPLPTGTKVSTT